MDLKKPKHFTSKKEDKFLVSFFFLFLFKLGKIQLWLSFTKVSSMLFENIYKICTEASVMEAILNKVLIPQNGLSQERLSISLTNNFLWFLQKIEQKRTFLNDNIVWCKNSRVFKDLSNSGSFFLFSVYTHIHVFLKNIPHKKLEMLLCKDKSSQKFHKCYS